MTSSRRECWLYLVAIACVQTAVAFLCVGFASICNADQTAFQIDALGPPPSDAPLVQPWRCVTLDREYSGQWVVLGDIDGDGEVEIVSARNVDKNDNHFTSAVVAHNLDGSILWKWGDSSIGRRKIHHDVACQIHDLDGDGDNEVVLAADRKLVVLNGTTGRLIRSFDIPEHASDCVVFADLTGRGRKTDILVKNRYRQIWAYTAEGKLLWTVHMPGGYRTAHQPFPVDLDGDDRDEILAGYAALNPDGTTRWVFEADEGKKNKGHADCWRIVRLAEKPEDTRLVLTMCGGFALAMTDGDGRLIWRQSGHHYESVDVGEICPDRPGLELIVDIDHLPKPPRPLCLFDERGIEFGRINTDYARQHALLDWDGDGIMEIAAAVPRGLFDGQGHRVLTFAVDEGYRPCIIMAADLTGLGMRDAALITTKGETYKVYLYRNPKQASGRTNPPLGSGINFTLY